MARRLRKKQHAALEVTAFINLIVVLVPFLLSTAVFSRMAVVELSLPAQSSGHEQLKKDNLQLEVVIRPDALEVGDRLGGLIERIPNAATGADTAALAVLMQQVKTRYPATNAASVLAEPNTPYDVLVQVMDAVRVHKAAEGKNTVVTELFSDISIGDAPVRKKVAGL